MVWKKIKKKFSFLRYIDPFYYIDEYLIPKINPKNNEAFNWVIYIASALILAFLIYSAFGLLLSTKSPMVIVVSASMEPIYHRGDVIVLAGSNSQNINAREIFLERETLENTPLLDFAIPNYTLTPNGPQIVSLQFKNGDSLPITKGGDVVVYFSELRFEPIIHRAVAKIHVKDGIYLLTKGDSLQNNTIDQDCGVVKAGMPSKDCITLYPVKIEELDGKAILQIPLVGCAKLWPLDNLISLLTRGRLPPDFRGVC